MSTFEAPAPGAWEIENTHLTRPITRWLGWTTMQQVDIFRKGALHVERQWKTSPRSLFTIVVARNAKATPSKRSVSAATPAESPAAP